VGGVVGVVVVVIWHTDFAGRRGGDQCCKRKEGEWPKEAYYRQNNHKVSYLAVTSVEEWHILTKTHIKAPLVGTRVLKMHHFKSTTIECYRIKLLLVGVQYFQKVTS
jgi:hypothetical protein